MRILVVYAHPRAESFAAALHGTVVETLTAAGETRTYLATKVAIRDDGGRVAGLVGVSRDVTAFKRAHEALWTAQQAQEERLQSQALCLRRLEDEFEEVILLSGRQLDHTLTRAHNFLTLGRQHPEQISAQDHAQSALEQARNLLGSLRHYMQTRTMRARMRPAPPSRA